MTDEFFMECALYYAHRASLQGQRPFGNVVVDEHGMIIGAGGGSELPSDPTRHSEMDAIRMACRDRGGLLKGCTLYSTHEPCLMCTGAILHAKLSRVVYGSCRDDLPSLFRPLTVGHARWEDTTHPPDVESGVLRVQCIALFDLEVAEKVFERGALRSPFASSSYDPVVHPCPECDALPGEPCIVMKAIASGFGDHGEYIPDCPREVVRS